MAWKSWLGSHGLARMCGAEGSGAVAQGAANGGLSVSGFVFSVPHTQMPRKKESTKSTSAPRRSGRRRVVKFDAEFINPELLEDHTFSPWSDDDATHPPKRAKGKSKASAHAPSPTITPPTNPIPKEEAKDSSLGVVAMETVKGDEAHGVLVDEVDGFQIISRPTDCMITQPPRKARAKRSKPPAGSYRKRTRETSRSDSAPSDDSMRIPIRKRRIPAPVPPRKTAAAAAAIPTMGTEPVAETTNADATMLSPATPADIAPHVVCLGGDGSPSPVPPPPPVPIQLRAVTDSASIPVPTQPEQLAWSRTLGDVERQVQEGFSRNTKSLRRSGMHVAIAYLVFTQQRLKVLKSLTGPNLVYAKNFLMRYSLDPTYEASLLRQRMVSSEAAATLPPSHTKPTPAANYFYPYNHTAASQAPHNGALPGAPRTHTISSAYPPVPEQASVSSVSRGMVAVNPYPYTAASHG